MEGKSHLKKCLKEPKFILLLVLLWNVVMVDECQIITERM